MASDTKLRTLDLFSGIGGISLALQPWCRTVCYCEIDPYAVGVLTKQMAAGNLDVAPVWDDVTSLGQSELAEVGSIDCITGGFPCQDISCAGKGAGINEGTRSGLFYEIIRLVRLARPRIVFLENVPAILARGLDTVLGELAESGYDARWRCLSAAEVGEGHIRERWFCIANPIGERLEAYRHNGGGGTIYKTRASDQDNSTDAVERFWETARRTYRGNDALPGRVDRLKCLGNAVVPLQARKAFELLTATQRN